MILNKCLAIYFFNPLHECFCFSREKDFLEPREYLPVESWNVYKIHFLPRFGDAFNVF